MPRRHESDHDAEGLSRNPGSQESAPTILNRKIGEIGKFSPLPGGPDLREAMQG